MAGNFSFSFSGDDIDDENQVSEPGPMNTPLDPSTASAFPVAGKPLLPATRHDIHQMISELPSKVAYGLLDVDLDGQGNMQLPRRELWDVRVQLMAEADDGETGPGLDNHDVKTGVYEGGFKSWESSVDLVKVLSAMKPRLDANSQAPTVIEVSSLFCSPPNMPPNPCVTFLK